jgi:hypothetical protein
MAAVNGGIGLKLAQLLSRNSPSPAKPGDGFWHLDAYMISQFQHSSHLSV